MRRSSAPIDSTETCINQPSTTHHLASKLEPMEGSRRSPAICGSSENHAFRAIVELVTGSPMFDINLVRKEGLEPSRVTPLEPKSSASTSSATFAIHPTEFGGGNVSPFASPRG